MQSPDMAFPTTILREKLTLEFYRRFYSSSIRDVIINWMTMHLNRQILKIHGQSFKIVKSKQIIPKKIQTKRLEGKNAIRTVWEGKKSGSVTYIEISKNTCLCGVEITDPRCCWIRLETAVLPAKTVLRMRTNIRQHFLMITFLEISLRVVTPSCFYTAISQNASAEDPLSAWSVSLELLLLNWRT